MDLSESVKNHEKCIDHPKHIFWLVVIILEKLKVFCLLSNEKLDAYDTCKYYSLLPLLLTLYAIPRDPKLCL